MYFIQENDKPNWFIELLSIVRLKDNRIYLPISKKEISEKGIKKLAKKTAKILRLAHTQKVILSKEIHKQKEYVASLESMNLSIADGKWLFKMLAIDSLGLLVEKHGWKKEEMSLGILVNEGEEANLSIIRELAKTYKQITIVTNHRERFKKIEKELYEEEGVIITISNHKRKSLHATKLILNLDFPEQLVNGYRLHEEAIIVNLPGEMRIKNKRFNGVVVQDYEIVIPRQEEWEWDLAHKFYQKELYEAQFYQKQPFSEIRNRIKKDGIQIETLLTRSSCYTF